MLMIAMNLCYIHVGPLHRRFTTTQTSTRLIGFARCEWLCSRCGHYQFSFAMSKNTLGPRSLSTFLPPSFAVSLTMDMNSPVVAGGAHTLLDITNHLASMPRISQVLHPHHVERHRHSSCLSHFFPQLWHVVTWR